MGEGWQGISASENDGLGSCEAHHVGFGSQEDRSGTAGTVEETKGREEGGVRHDARMKPDSSVAGLPFDEESLRAECQMR
jgi:hypothetical protein